MSDDQNLLFDEKELIPEEKGISIIDINDEMKKSYLEYAMSVIVWRALPDVRDGLKPVHRRILYSMHDAGFTAGRAYKKCARIVGDVLGRYHPHGDTAVYDSLVRMAQDFSLRYPLIDGQGNYGSVDGDNAAAMRYTEARMSKISMTLLEDIEKETVDFTPNFDESLEEPTVLPTKIPGLLLNGASGIAVGMATNIPPHNLIELVDGICALIDNPELDVEGLMEYIKGPDLPTAGIICGDEGIRKAYSTGKGSFVTRARISFEETKKGREAIIVEELPYQVNKANLIIKIAELVGDKKIPGISDLRDESDRNGMRIYIELKRDASKDIVLNQLYKHTQLQNSFGINMVAIVSGVPKLLNLKQVLSHYILHRKEVVIRRTKYDLRKAKDRLHILEGLRIALENIDEVITLIKKSPNAESARTGLIERFSFSEKQASAILEMRLQRLTGLERNKIENEYKELLLLIDDLEDILASDSRIFDIIKTEQNEIKNKFGDARRTEIGLPVHIMSVEDLIPNTQVAVLISKNGFIKRMGVDQFRSQNRGGRGISSMTTRDEDSIEHLIVTQSHNYLLCFTTKGRVFKIKSYQVPEASRLSKGVSLSHFLNFEDGEVLTSVVDIKEFSSELFLFMTTKKGVVKKTTLESFVHFKNKPILAINLDKDDELTWVKKTNGEKNILLITQSGILIRFQESQVRAMGRASRGIRGIKIRNDDSLIAMNVINHEDDVSRLLIITRYGYGKNIRLSEFRCQNRGGIGVKCLSFRKSIKNDSVKDAVIATRDQETIIVTEKGTLCKQDVGKISTQKREAQGVRIVKCDNKDFVIAMSVVKDYDVIDEESK